MTKRPRLSTNLHAPEKAPVLAPSRSLALTGGSTPATTGPIQGEVQKRLRVLADQQKVVPHAGKGDSLAAIFGDALIAMSTASFLSWNQGMILQLRLSSLMLNSMGARPGLS